MILVLWNKVTFFTYLAFELFIVTGAQIFGENMHTNPELNIRTQKGLVSHDTISLLWIIVVTKALVITFSHMACAYSACTF